MGCILGRFITVNYIPCGVINVTENRSPLPIDGFPILVYG